MAETVRELVSLAEAMPPPAPRRHRAAAMLRALIAADIVALLASTVLVELLFGSNGSHDRVGMGVELLVFAATLPGWLVGAKLFALYDRDDERTDHSTVDDLVRVFLLVTVGAWLLFVAA